LKNKDKSVTAGIKLDWLKDKDDHMRKYFEDLMSDSDEDEDNGYNGLSHHSKNP
jgi:hypothetical protein